LRGDITWIQEVTLSIDLCDSLSPINLSIISFEESRVCQVQIGTVIIVLRLTARFEGAAEVHSTSGTDSNSITGTPFPIDEQCNPRRDENRHTIKSTFSLLD
jgi:hypothetical protein